MEGVEARVLCLLILSRKEGEGEISVFGCGGEGVLMGGGLGVLRGEAGPGGCLLITKGEDRGPKSMVEVRRKSAW